MKDTIKCQIQFQEPEISLMAGPFSKGEAASIVASKAGVPLFNRLTANGVACFLSPEERKLLTAQDAYAQILFIKKS